MPIEPVPNTILENVNFTFKHGLCFLPPCLLRERNHYGSQRNDRSSGTRASRSSVQGQSAQLCFCSSAFSGAPCSLRHDEKKKDIKAKRKGTVLGNAFSSLSWSVYSRFSNQNLLFEIVEICWIEIVF